LTQKRKVGEEKLSRANHFAFSCVGKIGEKQVIEDDF